MVEMVGESRCQGRLRHRCGGLRSLTAVFRVASYYPPGYEPTLLSWTWVQLPSIIFRHDKTRQKAGLHVWWRCEESSMLESIEFSAFSMTLRTHLRTQLQV